MTKLKYLQLELYFRTKEEATRYAESLYRHGFSPCRFEFSEIEFIEV